MGLKERAYELPYGRRLGQVEYVHDFVTTHKRFAVAFKVLCLDSLEFFFDNGEIGQKAGPLFLWKPEKTYRSGGGAVGFSEKAVAGAGPPW